MLCLENGLPVIAEPKPIRGQLEQIIDTALGHGCKDLTAPRRHESGSAACQTAKRYFDSLGLKKLPSMQSQKQEYAKLESEKKKNRDRQQGAR